MDKLLAAIEVSKKQAPEKFLFGLGIDLVGEATAEELLAQPSVGGDLDRLLAMTEDELVELPNVGPETARTLAEASKDPHFRRELDELRELGLELCFRNPLAKPPSSRGTDAPPSGLTLVITGTLDRSRDDIKKDLKALGANLTDSVSKNTSAVVAGESAGSKLDKAQKLGIPVWGQSELDQLLKGKRPAL